MTYGGEEVGAKKEDQREVQDHFPRVQDDGVMMASRCRLRALWNRHKRRYLRAVERV